MTVAPRRISTVSGKRSTTSSSLGGVYVIVVPPPLTNTAVLAKLGFDPRTMPMKPMSVEQCVSEGLNALRENRSRIVPGRLNRFMDASVPAFVKRTFTAKMLGKALAKPQARGPKPNNGRVMNRGCRKSLEVWKYVVDNGQLRNWPNEPALYYKNLGAYGVRYLFVI
jgi:hypothetical protein